MEKYLSNLKQQLFFHEREIWFCHIGLNVGFEQDGRGVDFLRPVLIIKKFNNQIFWAVSLTKAIKQRRANSDKYYYKFCFIDGIQSTAILSQLKLIDNNRLTRQIGVMPKSEFIQLNKKLKALLP